MNRTAQQTQENEALRRENGRLRMMLGLNQKRPSTAKIIIMEEKTDEG